MSQYLTFSAFQNLALTLFGNIFVNRITDNILTSIIKVFYGSNEETSQDKNHIG